MRPTACEMLLMSSNRVMEIKYGKAGEKLSHNIIALGFLYFICISTIQVYENQFCPSFFSLFCPLVTPGYASQSRAETVSMFDCSIVRTYPSSEHFCYFKTFLSFNWSNMTNSVWVLSVI